MRKLRILSLCLLLFLLTGAGRALALEGVYAETCPLNVRPQVQKGEDGATLLLAVFNATGHAVDYIEFSMYILNELGEPAKNGETHFFRAYAENLALEPYAERAISWSLASYPGAADYAQFRMEKVVFSEGTQWTRPETVYAQAYLYAKNPKTTDGAYLLDAERTLTLVDYSYSSYARTWYIWNDGPGWVPFSHDLVAKCQIWQPGAAIKLVINDDESLYTIESFRVALSPGEICVQAYETGKVENALPSGMDEAQPSFFMETKLPVGHEPVLLGLWDFTESADRAWAIWDGENWIDFSFDRGPVCQIWRPGITYIRLSYPDAAAVYAISVQMEEENRVY